MRYRYYDLHQQQAGTTVTARIEGSVCNLILVNKVNFDRYRAGTPFLYAGGHQRRSPVSLEIPEDGHWYAVVDLGGYKGRVKATVELERPDGSASPKRPRSLVLS